MSRISVPLVATLGGGSIGQELNPLTGTRIYSDFTSTYSDWKTEQTASSGFGVPTYSSQATFNPNTHGVITLPAASGTIINAQSRIADRLKTDPAPTLKVGNAEMDFLIRMKFDRGNSTGMLVRMGFFSDLLTTPPNICRSSAIFKIGATGAVSTETSNEYDGTAGFSYTNVLTLADFAANWHTYGIYIPKNGNYVQFSIDGVVMATVLPIQYESGQGTGTNGSIPNTSASVGLNVGIEAFTQTSATTSAKTISVDFMRYRYLHERIS
jgi:hypothetical protein